MKSINLTVLILPLTMALPTSSNGRQRIPRQSGNQEAECWEEPGQNGRSVIFDNAVTDLGMFGFNDTIASCCFYGTWLLYDRALFNSPHGDLDNEAEVFYNADMESCVNLPPWMADRASSIRFAGATEGYRFDTLNLYQGDNFIGHHSYLIEDTPQMEAENEANSAIVTGISTWTLFENFNYKGRALCVQPVGDINLSPGFLFMSDLGELAGRVSSVHKGCLSPVVVRARPFPTRPRSEISNVIT